MWQARQVLPKRKKVDHPQIRAITFVTVVEDPLNDWADIWVHLGDGRIYSFTVYTPSQIVTEMEEENLLSHNDYDQVIVREMTIPCIVDAVEKMLEIGCIDRIGALHVKSRSARSRRKRAEIRAVEWLRKRPPGLGTEIAVELTNGCRYRFTAYSIASIAEDLRKPDHLSFVRDGLLVVKEANDECIRDGLREMIEWHFIDHCGVALDAKGSISSRGKRG